MKKNIKIKQRGLKSSLFTDVYYHVLKSSWLNFLVVSALIYLLLNFFFALIYYYSPAEIINANQDSLWDAFIFSFQTSSTLGYGYLLPESKIAHMIVIADTMMGIFYVAIITGLAFSKFARPSAKVLFTDKVILSTFDHIPTLMFRIANNRDTHIVDASLNVAALIPYVSKEGHTMRRFYALPLVSNNNPTFTLSWTAMHQINESSPLYNMSLKDMKNKGVLIFVSINGIDAVLAQTIHSNHRYNSDDFYAAKKFIDILEVSKKNEYTIDFTKFHDIVV
jgi:inward rectifier potassium channel